MKTSFLYLLFTVFGITSFSQGFNIGDSFNNTSETFDLIGISSKDNSRIYRYKGTFPSTVFSYTVDKFEIKVHKGLIVSLHFVLNPKDNTGVIPKSLIEQIKIKSGTDPTIKDSKYYFDEYTSRTVVYRDDLPQYGGDRIFIMVISKDYLYK